MTTINITSAWITKETTQEARERIIADCVASVNKEVASASSKGLFRVAVKMPGNINQEDVADLFRYNGYTVSKMPPSPEGIRYMFQWEVAEAPPEETDPEETDPVEPPEETDPVEPPEETDPVEPPEETDPVEPPEETDPVEPPEETDPPVEQEPGETEPPPVELPPEDDVDEPIQE